MLDDLPLGIIFAAGIAWFIGYLMGQRSQQPTAKNSIAKRLELQQLIDKLSDNGRQRVEESLHKGQLIEAIRAFRAETNAGLKDAKDAIDLMRDNQFKRP